MPSQGVLKPKNVLQNVELGYEAMLADAVQLPTKYENFRLRGITPEVRGITPEVRGITPEVLHAFLASRLPKLDFS